MLKGNKGKSSGSKLSLKYYETFQEAKTHSRKYHCTLPPAFRVSKGNS